MAINLVRLSPSGDRLFAGEGQPFFILGVNYEGYYDRPWRMWDQFDAALIEKDFRKAREAGFNVARIFVQKSLAREIEAGNYAKLDRVLDLARRQELYILLTFNDYHDYDLARVGRFDAQVAQRYAEEPIIMGYDLENEPGFYSIVSAEYPAAHQAPVQTTALIDRYGERKSQAEVDAWRQTASGGRIVPGRLSSWLGYLYANAYFLYLDFLKAAGDWVREHGGTTVDYMNSPESAPWQRFLEVLDGTVRAWIGSQVEPIRAADPHHLITVGYNNLIFASQPANSALDFQCFHRYGSMSLWGLRGTFELLDKLRASFPGQPLVLGEFGYSNATGASPDTARPVEPTLTSIYETAVYLYLRAHGFDGGCKWMLNDIWHSHNPYEDNFGVFKADDQPKPIRYATACLFSYWDQSQEQEELVVAADSGSGAGYVYSAADALFVGGSGYQDERLTFRPLEPAQAFVSWVDPQEIVVAVTASGGVTIDPARLVSGWEVGKPVALYRLEVGERVREALFPSLPLSFTAQAGKTYVLVAETVLVTWHFAQAVTPSASQTWLALMNPQAEPATVTVAFRKEDGSTVARNYVLQPTSRLSIQADEVVPSGLISTLVESDRLVYAERTTYFGHDGYTCAGLSAPSRTWYFAEGYTGPGYSTRLVLLNPLPTLANVTTILAKEDGSTVVKGYALDPLSRFNIYLNRLLPNSALATKVEADQPIIAERATYFGQGGGHGTVGASAPARTWYLPEGYTGPGYTTWLLLFNPNQASANVTVTFMKEDGSTVKGVYTLKPTSRFTRRLNRIVPNAAFATLVEADQPIVAERASYFADGRSGHSSIGAPAPARAWHLPEGSTAGKETFILLMNPNGVSANVTLTFMRDDGSVVEMEDVIRPTSRRTIRVGRILPNATFATRVTSDQPLVVERAMYFNAGRGGTASIGIPQP